MEIITVLIYLAVWLGLGFLTKYIANQRGYEGGFWWGFFLGVIGIIVVCARPAKPLVPSSDKPSLN